MCILPPSTLYPPSAALSNNSHHLPHLPTPVLLPQKPNNPTSPTPPHQPSPPPFSPLSHPHPHPTCPQHHPHPSRSTTPLPPQYQFPSPISNRLLVLSGYVAYEGCRIGGGGLEDVVGEAKGKGFQMERQGGRGGEKGKSRNRAERKGWATRKPTGTIVER